MVYQTVIKKKRFEEEGKIAIPQKNRPFKLKERMVITEAQKAREAPKAPEVETRRRIKFDCLTKVSHQRSPQGMLIHFQK